MPKKKKMNSVLTWGVVGSLATFYVPQQFRITAVVLGVVVGYEVEPD